MIELKNIYKIYNSKNGKVTALHDLSLTIRENEFVVIRGASGSGKSTLLLTLGAMLSPTNGNVNFMNQDIYLMNTKQRNLFRSENIGFVFQMFHLLPYLTVLENVKIANIGTSNSEAKKILIELGLEDRINHKPFALSAGEKQRTAVARALISHPKIILADEPTGNLDPENTTEVVKCFSKYHSNGGTVVVVTHGTEADQFADRIINLNNGKIVKE